VQGLQELDWTVGRDLQLDNRYGADAAQPELVVQHLVDGEFTQRLADRL
jgi:hypothetical protein